MFENIMNFFKKFNKKDEKVVTNSKDAAKERLHLVLMQDRANVSADFLELMKQEIIEVIKKYIDVDEGAIDVRLTNKENEDGTNGAPALYANIPILNIKNEARKVEAKEEKEESNKENKENKKKTEEVEKKENEKAAKKEEKKEEKEEKEEKIEETAEVIIDNEEKEKQQEEVVISKEEKAENTEEELKSEN